MTAKYRRLTTEEIERLNGQQCRAASWSDIEVAEGFDAARVRATNFSGLVRLGKFDKDVTFFGDVSKPAGISNATLHNCTVGDNVYIDQIRNYIANYTIEEDVVIENVDLLAVEGTSSFGNGIEVAVLNEAGGREIPIYDSLSAHLAYIIALYRHRPAVIAKLGKMIDDYTKSVSSDTGLIGARSRLINCRSITNVKAGPDTTIEGIDQLENGSINSSPEDPVYIGPSVIARNFIVCSGCRITGGAIISNCFVGQGTILAKHYSAENSVFFANCGGYHGEACSIFAGPYTITHHKSTLLIAGLFSFLNAGSGSNQSNHLYKLGPVHQGIVERGSKTTSDSYILWPARVGAFTVIMGRHYKNSDTSDLPFSYLIEHEDESILVPAVNLRSVGTIRDAGKWPQRDRRKDPKKLDFINFQLLSPYTAQKMINGTKILERLGQDSSEMVDHFIYNGAMIRKSSLQRGIEFYQIGVDKFLGNCLIRRLRKSDFTRLDELKKILMPRTDKGRGKWVDLSGLFAPEDVVEELLCGIEDGSLGTLEKINEMFESIYNNYNEYEWSWAASVLEQRAGKSIDEITADELVEIIERWKSAVLRLDQMLYDDAKKEFAATAQIGYGIDGDEGIRKSDFEQVRGSFEESIFISQIKEHSAAKKELADKFISKITLAS